MQSSIDLLIDSDAFVGLIFPDDAHHQKTKQIFQKIEQQHLSVASTNVVIMETATVLSYRQGQELARTFLKFIEATEMPIIRITEKLEQKTYTLFKEQTKKGTSFIDCANVTTMQAFAIPHIFSFDQGYEKQFSKKLYSNVL